MPVWLANPKRRRKSRKRRAHGRKSRKRVRRNYGGFVVNRTHKRRTRRKGGSVARRRKRGRKTFAANRRRGSRRRFRRNPGFRLSGGNIVGRFTRGVKDVGLIIAGKVVSRSAQQLATKFGLPGGTVAGAAIAALAGIFAAPIVGKFAGGGDAGRFVLAGALLAPLETLAAGIPVVGPFLSDGDYLAAIPGDYSIRDMISGDGNDSDDDDMAMGGYSSPEGVSGYLSPVF